MWKRFIHQLQNPCLKASAKQLEQSRVFFEETKLLLGRSLCESLRGKKIVADIKDVEFRVFSQFGDDGIIQYLVKALGLQASTFVEFGIGDYRESNTRFLLQNNNWRGFVIDSSSQNIEKLKAEWYYWRHDLKAECHWVTRDNINGILQKAGMGEQVGLLHIDLDGNDYWVWEAITVIDPGLVIAEYNSLFGATRAITIPYDERFDTFQAHYSGLFFGASLSALELLADQKGYCFIGCNSAGNNAYFAKKHLLGPLRAVTVADGYVESAFRQSRDAQGVLNFMSNAEAAQSISGLRVYDVRHHCNEAF